MGVRNGRDRADAVPTSTVQDRRRIRRPSRGSGTPGPLLIVGLPQLPVVPRDGPAGLEAEPGERVSAFSPGVVRCGDRPQDATDRESAQLEPVLPVVAHQVDLAAVEPAGIARYGAVSYTHLRAHETRHD